MQSVYDINHSKVVHVYMAKFITRSEEVLQTANFF